MPKGCGYGLAGAAYYLPCAAWLWPEVDGEQTQPILQPPAQNLAECLIPPTQQPEVSKTGPTSDQQNNKPGELS